MGTPVFRHTLVNFRSTATNTARPESNSSIAKPVAARVLYMDCVCSIGDSSLTSMKCRNTSYFFNYGWCRFRIKWCNLFLEYRYHPWNLQRSAAPKETQHPHSDSELGAVALNSWDMSASSIPRAFTEFSSIREIRTHVYTEKSFRVH